MGREIWGVNPETGKLRWYCEGINSDSFYSSIVAADGIVYAVEGRGGGSIAVRVGGKWTLFVLARAAKTIMALTFVKEIVTPKASVSTPARSMSSVADAARVR